MGCIAVEDCTFLVGGLEGLKGVYALASFGLNHRHRSSARCFRKSAPVANALMRMIRQAGSL